MKNKIQPFTAVYIDSSGNITVKTDADYSSKEQFLRDVRGNGLQSRGVYTKKEIETVLDTRFITDLPKTLQKRSDATLWAIKDYFLE